MTSPVLQVVVLTPANPTEREAYASRSVFCSGLVVDDCFRLQGGLTMHP